MLPPRRPALALVVLVGALALSAPALAVSSGPKPDPGFSAGEHEFGQGIYSADLSGAKTDDEARAVTALADGSLVVAGTAEDTSGHHHVVLLKLRTDGTPDPSFGTDGHASWNVPGATDTAAAGMLVDTEGRIVVTGTSDGAVFVARFSSAFVPDTTFGTSGATIVTDLPAGQAHDLQEQADGRIVVVAQGGTTPKLQVLRFTAAGALDRSFGTAGITAIPGSGVPLVHAGVTVTSDARIVVAGSSGAGASRTGLLARLTQTGALDTTFSGDGRLPVAGRELTDLVRLPTGNLAAVGPTTRSFRGAVRLVLVSPSGALTNWPGTSSPQRTQVLGDEDFAEPLDLALNGDGRLLLTGVSGRSDFPDQRWMFLRTTTSGAFDPGYVYSRFFGNPVSDGEHSMLHAGTFALDGKVVVAGVIDGPAATPLTGAQTGVARFLGTTVAKAAVTELRGTYSTGYWKACGTTAAKPCVEKLGTRVYFGGRTWPAPPTGTTTLQVQRTSGTAVTSIEVGPTREGNLAGSFVPASKGAYRVRLRVPASATTNATTGAWRYLTVG